MSSSAGPICCVGAVLVRNQKILLIQRKNSPAKNLWSIPGGRLNQGESWQAAVEREVREETALVASCGSLIGWVECKYDDRRYLIADFQIEADNLEEASPGDDAIDLVFASRRQLGELELTPGLIEFLTQHTVLNF